MRAEEYIIELSFKGSNMNTDEGLKESFDQGFSGVEFKLPEPQDFIPTEEDYDAARKAILPIYELAKREFAHPEFHVVEEISTSLVHQDGHQKDLASWFGVERMGYNEIYNAHNAVNTEQKHAYIEVSYRIVDGSFGIRSVIGDKRDYISHLPPAHAVNKLGLFKRDVFHP